MKCSCWGSRCSAAHSDYAIYEGTIGAWYSHVPLQCGTGNGHAIIVVPGAATPNHYYLLVPVTSAAEGSYGLDSNGAERPVSTSPCKPAQDLACN